MAVSGCHFRLCSERDPWAGHPRKAVGLRGEKECPQVSLHHLEPFLRDGTMSRAEPVEGAWHKTELKPQQSSFRRQTKTFQSCTETEMSLSCQAVAAIPLFHCNRSHIFKGSFSNIRLKIRLVLSQGDHTDTITNISFHYCFADVSGIFRNLISSASKLDQNGKGQKMVPWISAVSVGVRPASLTGPPLSLLSFGCFS